MRRTGDFRTISAADSSSHTRDFGGGSFIVAFDLATLFRDFDVREFGAIRIRLGVRGGALRLSKCRVGHGNRSLPCLSRLTLAAKDRALADAVRIPHLTYGIRHAVRGAAFS